MATTDVNEEMRGYARRHLLAHLRAAGQSEEQIQGIIAQIPSNFPDKEHYVQQYLEGVPADQREEVANKLRGNSPA
jgi:hypothetical protein